MSSVVLKFSLQRNRAANATPGYSLCPPRILRSEPRRLSTEHSTPLARHVQVMAGLHAWDCSCGTRNAPHFRACRECRQPAGLGKAVWGEPPTAPAPAWARGVVAALVLFATVGMLALATLGLLR